MRSRASDLASMDLDRIPCWLKALAASLWVIFVFAPDSEIRFTTATRVADFERLYPAVRRSLFSWRWERQK